MEPSATANPNSTIDHPAEYSSGCSSTASGTSTSTSLTCKIQDVPGSPGVNFMPINLFQDSCNLKLDCVPDKYKTFITDLIDKISYQINFFSIADNSASKLKLTCKLCLKTLDVTEVERHTEDQDHLSNLIGRCPEGNVCVTVNSDNLNLSTSVSGTKSQPKSATNNLSQEEISTLTHYLKEEEKNFVIKLAQSLKSAINDLQPTYSGSNNLYFKCKVCNTAVGRKDVKAHVKSDKHRKNVSVKAPKPDKARKKVSNSAVVFKSLRKRDEKQGQELSSKLKEKMNDFNPFYIEDKLYFQCRACRLKLRPEKLEAHAHKFSHLSCAVLRLFRTNYNAAKKEVGAVELSQVPPSYTERTVKELVNLLSKHLNEQDKKIVLGFGQSVWEIFDSFELSNRNAYPRLAFICSVCRLTLLPKYVQSHLNSCSRVENLMSNLFQANVEDLNSKNRKILHELSVQLNYQLFFFQLCYEIGQNQLRFFCNVCHLCFTPKQVSDHITSNEHVKSLRSKPSSVSLKSLNQSNQSIVKKITAAIRKRKTNFSLVYKIGTEELHFFCNYCQNCLNPENVEDHVKSRHHQRHAFARRRNDGEILNQLKSKLPLSKTPNKTSSASSNVISSSAQETSFSSDRQNLSPTSSLHSGQLKPEPVPFHETAETSPLPIDKTLSSQQISSVARDSHQNFTVVSFDSLSEGHKKVVKMCAVKADYFEFLLTQGSKELYLRCKLCNLIEEPFLTQSHLISSIHLENVELSALFDNFQPLEEPLKCILRNLFGLVGKKAGAYYLLKRIGDKNQEIRCKLCGTSFPLATVNHAQFLADHLLAEDHLVATSENVNQNCVAAKASVSSILSGSKLVASTERSKVEEENSPSGVSSNTPSGPPNQSSSDCNLLNGNSSVEPSADHEVLNQIPSQQIAACPGFFCTDCSTVYNLKTDSPAVRSIFITCLKKCSAPTDTGILTDLDKEILKTLIDLIGPKIRDFEWQLKPRLHFRCKLCSLQLSPESLETHITNETHCRLSQLANIPSARFTSQSEKDKKVTKRIFNRIGIKINNFHVETSINFVCKSCGLKVAVDDVENHTLSAGHLKQVSDHSSQKFAALVSPGSHILALLDKSVGKNSILEKTSTQSRSLSSVSVSLCQKKPMHSKSPEGQVKEGTALEDGEPTSENTQTAESPGEINPPESKASVVDFCSASVSAFYSKEVPEDLQLSAQGEDRQVRLSKASPEEIHSLRSSSKVVVEPQNSTRNMTEVIYEPKSTSSGPSELMSGPQFFSYHSEKGVRRLGNLSRSQLKEVGRPPLSTRNTPGGVGNSENAASNQSEVVGSRLKSGRNRSKNSCSLM